jgi:hypothetical protein
LLDILAVAEMQTEGSPTWFTKGMFTLSTPHERLHSIRKRSRRLGVAAAAFALAATSLAAGAPAANATDATPESITETVYFASMQSKLDDVAQATLDVFLLRVPLDATDVSASVVGWVMATRSKANDRRLSKALEGLWPETREAMDVAESLLRAWDDVLADRHFAHNLDLDQPRSERRHAAAEASAALGGFSRLPETLESRTPAHARWRVSGAAGSAWIEVLMSPDPEPLIQTLRFDLAVD